MSSYRVDKQFLIGAQIPQETRTYKPVSHQEIIDLTYEMCEQSGFTIESETYNATEKGLVANGKYLISNVSDSEMKLELGWQNSYNKTKKLKYAIGVRVLVCNNGCVSGDMGSFGKKHRGDIQEFAPLKISEYIKSSGDVFQMMVKERDMLKGVEINPRVRAELIGRMFIEETFVQSTQLNVIAKEIANPTHDYKAPNTMWELYNYTTFAMKEIHPSLWMENHIDAHRWFVNEAGSLTGTTSIIVPTPVIEMTANF
jgi:hypothetical protein